MGFDTVYEFLQDDLIKSGFEVYPFLISWYNAVVEPSFKLKYDDSTVAFLIISTPHMFEKTFLPYAVTHKGTNDPVDSCIKLRIEPLIKKFSDHDIDLIYDYELWPNRRPKIIMQTVGHITGAAHFYSRHQLTNDPFPKEKNMLGVCIHPKYGGWFALRAVLVFKTLTYPLLKQQAPIDHLKENETLIVDLLRRFNDCWQDNTYRDIIPVIGKYSLLQQSYFKTLPKQRLLWLEKLLQNESINESNENL
ncbi:unnamed protein product [Didymodactylos carnosus]|uniref:Cyanocobalamin reductase (cyanide-eliminating) n=1 Tax=Didymodactylos carnosus TaxID=1234261 RepID=A0A8S2S0M0_9BILA|nr:unnamed protein product [Didymodactylos carnosus]CAF4191266.1 unnamed protein product [Didymodactylos carnosus]